MAAREHNRRGQGDHLRTDLVRAATELLVTAQPLTLPSLRAIARQVGCSPSAVYMHFDSQNALLRAVLDSQYDELRHALAAADRPRSAPERRVQILARAYVAWGIEHPGSYQLLFESADVLPADLSAPGPGADLLLGVAHLLREAHDMTERDASRVAMRMWTSLHGLVSMRIHKPAAPWTSSAQADADAVVAAFSALATPVK